MIYYLAKVYASCYKSKSLYLHYSTGFQHQVTLFPAGHGYPTTFAKLKWEKKNKTSVAIR